MSIHNIRNVTEILPEVKPLLKKASIEEEFPVNDRYSTLGSYLEMTYLTKVANQPVLPETVDRIKKAAKLYGIQPYAEKMASELVSRNHVKQASTQDFDQRLEYAQTYFDGLLSGRSDIEKLAEYAENLYDQYSEDITSDEIRRYAGVGHMDKESAVASLVSRSKLTHDPEFVKIARVIQGTRDDAFDPDDLRLICHSVTQLDKKAHLDYKGYNFYKEAVMTKESELMSALKINLGSKRVPVESIYHLGKENVAHVLGNDVATELFQGSAQEMKQVAETLPLDMKEELARLV